MKIPARATSTAAPADGERHARGDQRTEHEDQREGGQGQRDQLAARGRSVSVTAWTSP